MGLYMRNVNTSGSYSFNACCNVCVIRCGVILDWYNKHVCADPVGCAAVDGHSSLVV